jgi:hypothetical protein
LPEVPEDVDPVATMTCPDPCFSEAPEPIDTLPDMPESADPVIKRRDPVASEDDPVDT